MSDRALEDQGVQTRSRRTADPAGGGAPASQPHRDGVPPVSRQKGWKPPPSNEISRQAGVAKGFIYARYPDKAALFVGAIQRLMEDAMGTLQVGEPLPDDVEEGLRAYGRRLLDLVLKPEALAFHRLFIAEAPKFPALAEHFIARNGLLDLVADVLAGYVDRGALAPGDARVRAEHFTILVIGIPRTLALLVGREPPAEEERRLRAAVRLFLYGCRAD